MDKEILITILNRNGKILEMLNERTILMSQSQEIFRQEIRNFNLILKEIQNLKK